MQKDPHARLPGYVSRWHVLPPAGRTPPRPRRTLLSLLRAVLEGPVFLRFFDKVEVANFEVASDAFSTFKVRGGSGGHSCRAPGT